MKGQISFEYLFILGIALAIIIPGGYLFYAYSKNQTDTVVSKEIVRAGEELVNTAEEIFTIGENSWQTLKLSFPEQLSSVYILDETEIVIEYWTQSGLTNAIFFSRVPLNSGCGSPCNLPFTSGVNKVKLTAESDHVLIE